MADTDGKPPKRRSLGGWKFVAAIVLILAYSGTAAYGVMSDTSVRGLTVKMFNVSRYCTAKSSFLKTLNYNVRGAIWSASSVQTSLSHLTFTLSVDGSAIGTSSQGDSSFAPGHSVPFNLTFTDTTLNPTSLPLSSRLVLTVSATVAAGLYSPNEAPSDNILQSFGSTRC
ncbi:hypothetical protein E6H34_09205 [Candidatus Bathyarchaeota archaeon]|nr:MAG: hypothetical protein E6H34_09205 [Candidatus Bathyarchaeota archaeon]